ncbi:hypothetical protein [Tessaracoccus sp. OH4464_COT-324]|uniref:hypothetical protein n=1 Tax=Tessaracoccus sp. OH4464_COT-324 TaxID=2491059 RepID=UPI000F637C33|nr:hypothetical protein [Tessaracoccus sp. OH4464_COT-324]RRD46370.1 hypothetical protein EII42_07625 [Tessaracoccus sp. OH4464_COT-324]
MTTAHFVLALLLVLTAATFTRSRIVTDDARTLAVASALLLAPANAVFAGSQQRVWATVTLTVASCVALVAQGISYARCQAKTQRIGSHALAAQSHHHAIPTRPRVLVVGVDAQQVNEEAGQTLTALSESHDVFALVLGAQSPLQVDSAERTICAALPFGSPSDISMAMETAVAEQVRALGPNLVLLPLPDTPTSAMLHFAARRAAANRAQACYPAAAAYTRSTEPDEETAPLWSIRVESTRETNWDQ